MKDCENSSDEDKDDEHGLQYGDWLHASPLRQPQKESSREALGILKRNLDIQFENNWPEMGKTAAVMELDSVGGGEVRVDVAATKVEIFVTEVGAADLSGKY